MEIYACNHHQKIFPSLLVCRLCLICLESEIYTCFLLQVAASMQKDVDGHVPSYPNLPSKLICLLHNVTLHVICSCAPFYCLLLDHFFLAKQNYFGGFIGGSRNRWSVCANDSPASHFSKYPMPYLVCHTVFPPHFPICSGILTMLFVSQIDCEWRSVRKGGIATIRIGTETTKASNRVLL